jgi:hypothetical protein
MRGEQLALLSSDRNCFSRKLWRKTSTFVFLMLLAGWAPLRASTPQFQKAVVLRVEKSQPTLPYRRRIADSPPPPNEYDFVVSLRMGCVVYIGLYQSAIDYLPSVIAADQSVDVSLEKHVMRVRSPGGKEITFEIARHYRASPGSCNSGH